jgi:hydroxyacylglutathione hydrolase
MKIQYFCFNPFQENTYILSDDKDGSCIIIDPGNFDARENGIMTKYLKENGLKPVKLINTHCHIDHILGNEWAATAFGLALESHEGEIPVLAAGEQVAAMYGIPYVPSPSISTFLKHGDEIIFGSNTLEVLFTPGHSPASICLYNKLDGTLIAGDVLFHRSIGRTDLPGGDYDTLLKSIRDQLFILPDDTKVFPGHGIATTIGDEKKHNPFLN